MTEFNPLGDLTKNALSMRLGYISNDQLYQLFNEVIKEMNKRKEWQDELGIDTKK